MRSAILAATILALAASSVPAKERALPPPEDRARARVEKAAAEAEAAYREDALGALKVLGSRLVDLERSAVRGEEIKEANRIRHYRERIARLAVEVSRHDFLGGVLPPIDRKWVPPSAKKLIEEAAAGISRTEVVYRRALRAAFGEVGGLLSSARRLAVDSADLDAANRVREITRGIVAEIAVRLEPLEYAEYRFSSIRHTHNAFLLAEPEAWRVQDRELIGTCREGEELEATLKRNFKRLSAVTVRGRVLPPNNRNFRVTVGPVNLILNWELAAECHFRYHEKRTVVRGNLLVPGREHEITVRQLTRRSIEVCIDGRRVWITHGTLEGTITVYPYLSTIGIREIRVLGVRNESETFDGPSHRRW